MIVDFMVFSLLCLAGITGIRTSRRMAGAHGSTYWLLAGIGMIYLGVDELLNVHETLGRELWNAGVPNPRGVNHLDDTFVFAYGVVGVIVTLRYWREIVRFRAVAVPFMSALAATALSIGVDAQAPVEGIAPYIEELSELAGAAFFFTAFRRRYSLEQALAHATQETSAPEPAFEIT